MNLTLRRILLYACLVAALMGYAFVEGRSAEQTAEAVTYGKLVLGGHAGFTRRFLMDSQQVVRLRASSARFGASEAYWRKLADSLQADTIDSGGLQKAPNLPAATIALGKALQACDGARSASDSALQVLQADLTLCRNRSDSLETAVSRLLKVRAPRFGFSVGPALLVSPNGSVHGGLAILWGFRF